MKHKTAPSKSSSGGFTLIELTVALAVFMVVTGVIFSLLLAMTRMTNTQMRRTDMRDEIRMASQRITQLIHMADASNMFTVNGGVLQTLSAGTPVTNIVIVPVADVPSPDAGGTQQPANGIVMNWDGSIGSGDTIFFGVPDGGTVPGIQPIDEAPPLNQQFVEYNLTDATLTSAFSTSVAPAGNNLGGGTTTDIGGVEFTLQTRELGSDSGATITGVQVDIVLLQGDTTRFTLLPPTSVRSSFFVIPKN